MALTLTITDFQVDQLERALRKRRQVLRAASRRLDSEETEIFQKLVVVEGLLQEIKIYKETQNGS